MASKASDQRGVPTDLTMKTPTQFDIFTLFPKLPTTLRRAIFSHAIYTPPLPPVKITTCIADPEFGLYIAFNALDPVPSSIALLSTCHESREVYLEHAPNSLTHSFLSVIRYDATKTTVFIENFNELMKDLRVAKAVNQGWRRQRWTTEIKKMAVPVTCFMGVVPSFWRSGNRGEFLKVFEGLEELVGVATNSFRQRIKDQCFSEEVLMRGLKGNAKVVRMELETYGASIDANYKVPRIGIREDGVGKQDLITFPGFEFCEGNYAPWFCGVEP